MRITVDTREHALWKALNDLNEKQEYNIELTRSHLELADFEIYGNNGLLHLVERKTSEDLLQSIHDGRYKEQCFRLNQHKTENKDIYYVIESKNIQKDQRIVSCVYSLNQRGFSTFRTTDINDTAYFLLCLTKKAEKMRIRTDNNTCTEVYTDTIKVKKKNLDPLYVTVSLFAQIPSISVKTAQVLSERFSCLEELMLHLRKDPNILNGMLINKRKLSKKVIENLKLYLLHENIQQKTPCNSPTISATLQTII
jgi:ERCC4-type nuclease